MSYSTSYYAARHNPVFLKRLADIWEDKADSLEPKPSKPTVSLFVKPPLERQDYILDIPPTARLMDVRHEVKGVPLGERLFRHCDYCLDTIDNRIVIEQIYCHKCGHMCYICPPCEKMVVLYEHKFPSFRMCGWCYGSLKNRIRDYYPEFLIDVRLENERIEAPTEEAEEEEHEDETEATEEQEEPDEPSNSPEQPVNDEPMPEAPPPEQPSNAETITVQIPIQHPNNQWFFSRWFTHSHQ